MKVHQAYTTIFMEAIFSTNVRDQFYENFIYPSITVCPEKTFKTSKEIPVDGPLQEIKNFYLGDVDKHDKHVFKGNNIFCKT